MRAGNDRVDDGRRLRHVLDGGADLRQQADDRCVRVGDPRRHRVTIRLEPRWHVHTVGCRRRFHQRGLGPWVDGDEEPAPRVCDGLVMEFRLERAVRGVVVLEQRGLPVLKGNLDARCVNQDGVRLFVHLQEIPGGREVAVPPLRVAEQEAIRVCRLPLSNRGGGASSARTTLETRPTNNPTLIITRLWS